MSRSVQWWGAVRRLARGIALSSLAGVGAACGGSDAPTSNSTACGPGTVLVDGVCVIADASADALDEGVADDGAAVDSGPGTDTASATDANDAADVPMSGGDPCPTSPIAFNCSNTCGGPSANCAQLKCQPDPKVVRIDDESKLPIIIRLPDKPGIDPACPKDCFEKPQPAYGILFEVSLPVSVRVRVEAPWRIGVSESFKPYCSAGSFGFPQCQWMFAGSVGYAFLVNTTDPNATGRNLVIEKGDKCP